MSSPNFDNEDESFDINYHDTVEDLNIALSQKANNPCPLKLTPKLILSTPLYDFHIDFILVLSQPSDTPQAASFLSKTIIHLHT